jgi:hypothetical protein
MDLQLRRCFVTHDFLALARRHGWRHPTYDLGVQMNIGGEIPKNEDFDIPAVSWIADLLAEADARCDDVAKGTPMERLFHDAVAAAAAAAVPDAWVFDELRVQGSRFGPVERWVASAIYKNASKTATRKIVVVVEDGTSDEVLMRVMGALDRETFRGWSV